MEAKRAVHSRNEEAEIAIREDDSRADDAPSPDPGAGAPPRRGRRRHRWWGWVALAAALLLAPVIWSYVAALTAPGSDSVAARTAEWMRGNHLGGVLNWVEHVDYSLHPPRKGGDPSASPIPSIATSTGGIGASTGVASTGSSHVGDVTAAPVGSTASTSTSAVLRITNPPAPLISPASHPVSGEGSWTPIGPDIGGAPGVYATEIRPDAFHTSYFDAVVWFDPSRVQFRQFPGTFYAAGPRDRPPYVPLAEQASLIAAFEGGFRPKDSRGGLVIERQSLAPLRPGAATLAIRPDGTVDVGILGRDIQASGGYDSIRQNLSLVVDGGAPVPALATDPNRLWGFTGPTNSEFVWRSGVGVTASGAVVWVGGPALSIVDLAQTLVRAGAVRGMQLDINQDWVQMNTYAMGPDGHVHGSKLLAAMRHTGDRYLTTDSRDFLAVFSRPTPLP